MNNSKNSKTQWTPPKDEIPGYTSFLYEANRFRADHEYVGYWKEEDHLDKLRNTIGVPLSDSEEDLLVKIDSLQHEITVLDDAGQIATLQSDLEDSQYQTQVQIQQIETLEQTSREERDQIANLVRKLQASTEALNKVLGTCVKYGRHSSECNFIEMAECGRASLKQEKTLCSCEWSSIKEDCAASRVQLAQAGLIKE